MTVGTLWLTFIGCGIVTFATRASFIALGDKMPLPPAVERALRYVAPAAFAAIAMPLILGGDGLTGFSADIPRIVAAAVAAVVIIRWRKMPLSLLIGMIVLWLLQWAWL